MGGQNARRGMCLFQVVLKWAAAQRTVKKLATVGGIGVRIGEFRERLEWNGLCPIF